MRKRGALRLLSAWELLEAEREAARLCEPEEAAFGLCLNACILARALNCGGGGARLLRLLEASQLEALAARYYALSRAESPAPGDADALDRLQRRLQHSARLRLYFRVLRAFGVLPNEKRARRLTDGQLLFLAAGLALDAEPQPPETEAEWAVNPAFDAARFQREKEAGA